jgi:hypothetical protein
MIVLCPFFFLLFLVVTLRDCVICFTAFGVCRGVGFYTRFFFTYLLKEIPKVFFSKASVY